MICLVDMKFKAPDFVNDIWTETKKGKKQEQLVLNLFTFLLNRFSSFSSSIAMLLLSLGGEAVLR